MKKLEMKLIGLLSRGLYGFGMALALVSCSKEEALTPTNGAEPMIYTLPQGNHPYDETLVKVSETYGCAVLYKFNSSDFRWNQVTKPLGYAAVEGDEAHVGEVVDFMFKGNLELGSEKLIKKLLPYRIFLASAIWPLTENPKSPTLYDTVKTNPQTIIPGFKHLAIGVANAGFSSYTAAQKQTMRGALHYNLWQLALTSRSIEMPPAFGLVTDYSSTNFLNLLMRPNENGLLFFPSGVGVSAMIDLQCYMQEMAKYTEAEFAAKYLIPSVDVKGLIKKKYDIVRNYYLLHYDTDVQIFGNAR
ncbi:hypothetical protein E2P86_10625 [Sphingobacterium psychroaquaticum]|uniref:hypothetical protein n=1 Tax=Sphingobacterium psychroaquaticum TaxID=561061 RepID=UPI00106D6531|nr:hypothetical protein [Sphingobacterium psychroaquaticum]QBQ41577.1 hypothetical protein E2P86_10625 [Sphingobacterium psychroaquaticum]